MAWATDTTGKNAHRVRYAITIQGVPQVFCWGQGFSPQGLFQESGRDRDQLFCVSKIDPGETRLDLEKRRSVGGGLTVEMAETLNGDLAALFAPRKERVTKLAQDVSSSGSVTTLNLGNGGSALTAPGHVYIDGETFYFGGRTGSQLTSVVRAQYDSDSQAHEGNGGSAGDMGDGFGKGADVYDVPHVWSGRRVQLWTGYQDEDASTAAVQLLGTWRLDSPPQYDGGGTWRLECSELADLFAEKELYVGITDEALPEPQAFASPLTVGDDIQDRIIAASESPYLLFSLDDNTKAIRRFTGYSSTDKITFDPQPLGILTGELDAEDLDNLNVESVRMVQLLEGCPSEIAMKLLRSGEGGTPIWDIYAGDLTPAAFGGVGLRMGANIASGDIDITAFRDADDVSFPWYGLLADTTTVEEVLYDYCQSVGAFWYIDASGQMTAQKLRLRHHPLETSSTLVLNSDVILHGSGDAVEIDESQVKHTTVLRANYDPLIGRAMAEINVFDLGIQRAYEGRSGAWVWESRWVDVNVPPSLFSATDTQKLNRSAGRASVTEVESLLRRTQAWFRKPVLRYVLPCSWKAMALNVGDVVSVTDAARPDGAGGTVSNRLGMVVGKRPNVEAGSVELRIRDVEKAQVWAPSHTVASYSSPNLTLATTDEYNNNGSSPGDAYVRSTTICVYDTSTDTVEEINASAVTSTTLELDTDPTFVSSPTAWIVWPKHDGSLTTEETASGLTQGDWAYMVATDYPDNGNASSVWS